MDLYERMREIMEKYDCDDDEALDILERKRDVVVFLANMANPYGKIIH